MLAGFPLVFRELLLGSEAETACKRVPVPNFVLESSESVGKGVVDAWKVSGERVQEKWGEGGET